MIRPAAHTDVQAIATLWNRMIRETLATFTTQEKSTAEIEKMIDARPDAFFVAEARDAFAGFLTFDQFRPGPGYAHSVEHSILVMPEFQGQTVAANLMQAGFDAARALGCHVMIAGISSANPRAVRFHAKHGFEQVGLLPEVGRKGGRWLDLVLMQKNLSAQ
jgi:phosphinothricin acetyltransferase